jgi:hypothetical protein
MLRANVGLSRKLSKDYNSTGYSINLDGEITAPVSDPEGVIEQVKELFDLAEETMAQQIDRSQGEAAIASHDVEPGQQTPVNRNGNWLNGSNGNGSPSTKELKNTTPSQNSNGNGNGNGHHQEDQPATNKQFQYLLSIGKRLKLSTVQLEKRISEILGRQVGVYDLSKQAAGVVIEALSAWARRQPTRMTSGEQRSLNKRFSAMIPTFFKLHSIVEHGDTF